MSGLKKYIFSCHFNPDQTAVLSSFYFKVKYSLYLETGRSCTIVFEDLQGQMFGTDSLFGGNKRRAWNQSLLHPTPNQ